MIDSITIKNFMVHSELTLRDIPSINLIIGKNDTGKTGILKLLYGTVKALEIYSIKAKQSDVIFKKELSDKLLDTFMPRKNGLGDLVLKGSKEKLDVNITIAGNNGKYRQPIYFSFGERTEKSISTCIDHVVPLPNNTINALFIPAKEVLTAFNDIRNIRELQFGVGFDDTYLDLIKALNIPTTKGRVANELSQVNQTLEDLFEGKIEQTGLNEQPFIFKKGNQQFAMQQTAEGIKKIGILTTLITNRQLGKGTILFMDEPETALHPDAIRQMVEMLVAMSKAGVQIFLASHSYFVIKQLANCAKRDELNVRCWNMRREDGKTIINSYHDLIDGVLPSNSIIDEALKMYDEEISIDLK
ncbi:AAA family ATPase [Flectobacillus longus]|uniref:AAA family ATPase n=1 Tax=Flectobacillus longus TaxID=2984207 RepID=UPI0024B81AD8|nr:ATP-binding protein [Flectobacillus longus]MDI9881864.1 ATP-binding protein [Flectobacillus longus]